MNYHPKTEYNFACRQILEFLRSELAMCGAVLYHQEGEAGVVEFMSGCIPGVIEGRANQSIDVIANAVNFGRCAQIVPDVAQSVYSELEVFQDFEPISIVATPISRINGENYSVLCGISLIKSDPGLTGRQALLEFCARQLQYAYRCYFNRTDSIEAIESLTEQAYQDAMTGLLNRNGWEAAVATRVSYGFGLHKCVSVFVIDVDDLKLLNDTQGHAAGDKAIRKVAVVLQHIFAPQGLAPITDEEPVVARTGGDEFICLQFDCDDEEAQVTIASIVAELSNAGISVSIGSACCRSVRKLPDAIVNADEAMYLQKKLSKPQRAAELVQFRAAG